MPALLIKQWSELYHSLRAKSGNIWKTKWNSVEHKKNDPSISSQACRQYAYPQPLQIK